MSVRSNPQLTLPAGMAGAGVLEAAHGLLVDDLNGLADCQAEAAAAGLSAADGQDAGADNILQRTEALENYLTDARLAAIEQRLGFVRRNAYMPVGTVGAGATIEADDIAITWHDPDGRSWKVVFQ